LGDKQVIKDLFEENRFSALINNYSSTVAEFAKSVEPVLKNFR
jgi:hypothetical protein